MNGLNQYDYSARYYDPAIARFTTMDPMAEKYYSVSPYVYCMNNPVNAVDPTGEYIWIFYKDKNGKQQRYNFGNAEERLVILNVENPAAETLGQGIRVNHGGKGIITLGVNSMMTLKEYQKLQKNKKR